MKYVVLTAFALIGSLELLGCARKPLVPVTPWADLADDSLSFFTTSTDPGGLKVCYVFDRGDGSTTTTDYFMSGDTVWNAHKFAGSVVRYIRVKARSEKGAESGWSPSLRFKPSRPPELGDIVAGPLHWAVDRWYHLSLSVSDPEGDSVAVKFLWGDLPAAGWSAFVPSGSVITDSCKWSVVGSHTVSIVLKDKGCMVSSPVEAVTVSISPMAILWTNFDDDRSYDATPTLGAIAGAPVLYCEACDGVDCYGLDGQPKWRAPLSTGTGFAASLSPDGSSLYLTDYNWGLVGFDAATGRRKWALALNCGYTPVVGPDGAVYVAAFDSDAVLKRVRDHGDSAAVDWSVSMGDNGSDCRPVLGRNGVIYAAGYDDVQRFSTLTAIDTGGKVLWKDTMHGSGVGSPVIDSRNRILVAGPDLYLYCFNPDGSVAWKVPTNALWTSCTAVAGDDQVIVTDKYGNVTSFDSDGGQRWQTALEISGGNTPCVAQDSTIIVGDAEGYLYGLSASDGSAKWQFSMWDSLDYAKRRARVAEGDNCPSTVIGPNGDLYLACEDGLFWVSSSDLRLAGTAWPTYNHDAAHSGWAGRPQ